MGLKSDFNMKHPKNLLVVISGKRKVHEALERALLFAESAKINIHLFNVIYQPIGDLTDLLSSKHREEMKQQYLADRELYLKELATEVEKKGIKCSIEIVWNEEIHEAIEAVAKVRKPDLVIKRISAHASSINPFAMPTDRHLLRYCPAPLLLIKESNWPKGPVCAAVDAMTKDSSHKQLNSEVLDYAKMLGKMSHNPIYALTSFYIPPVSTAMGVPGVDYEMILTNTQKSYQQRLQELVKPHNLPATNLYVAEGDAELAISRFAKENQVSLMVLGTVGRTGITAAFIGNTAERVLAELTCEILTIKPQVAK
jgi:universal stress protein E